MPALNLSKLPPLLQSSLIYGVSRAGKTVLAGTFPRPAIFTSKREGGYVSLQTMDPALWYEPNVAPRVYVVENIQQTNADFKAAIALAKAGKIRTFAFELSYYSDDVVSALKDVTEDQWAVYRALEAHIKFLDRAAKALGVRIAYNALLNPAKTDKDPASIAIAGKALAAKLPAGTDLTGYLRTEEKDKRIERVLHLTPYGQMPAGHRYGKRLPNVVRDPTFRKLEDVFNGTAVVNEEGIVLYGEAAEAQRNKATVEAAAAAQAPNGGATLSDLPDLSELPPMDEEGGDLPALDA